ncbi:hypothetical protein MJM04_36185, partial [Salmonella enterica subsp. enterica serovar Cerro]|nr:hypothetical protein [Salmonella enterica subsp. enterica serovar Cerro]
MSVTYRPHSRHRFVTNVAELNALVERVKKAQREYASFTQEQVDKIFRAAALAAAD